MLTTHLEPASSVLVEHISLWAAKIYLDFRDFEVSSADSLEYCPRSSSNWHGYCSSSLAQGDHKSSFNCGHQEADDRYRHKSRGRGVSRLNYIEPFHHCNLQLYACTHSTIRWRLGYWRGWNKTKRFLWICEQAWIMPIPFFACHWYPRHEIQ